MYGAVRLSVIGNEAPQPKAQFPSAEYADCARGITRLVNAALARACSIVGAGFAASYQPNLSEGSVSGRCVLQLVRSFIELRPPPRTASMPLT